MIFYNPKWPSYDQYCLMIESIYSPFYLLSRNNWAKKETLLVTLSYKCLQVCSCLFYHLKGICLTGFTYCVVHLPCIALECILSTHCKLGSKSHQMHVFLFRLPLISLPSEEQTFWRLRYGYRFWYSLLFIVSCQSLYWQCTNYTIQALTSSIDVSMTDL